MYDNLFLNNKYSKWYKSIISNARLRTNVDEYTEKHHILPRTLGGDNSASNLVDLTAREHFICHWLLTKMLKGDNKYKMIYALHRFMYPQQPSRYKITSKKFELLKSIPRTHTAEAKMKMHVSAKRRPKPSKETVEKRAAKLRGRPSPLKGRHTHTDESKNKISQYQKQLLSNMSPEEHAERIKRSCSSPESWTKERIDKMKKNMIGKKRANTENIGRANKGKTWKLINGTRVWLDKEK